MEEEVGRPLECVFRLPSRRGVLPRGGADASAVKAIRPYVVLLLSGLGTFVKGFDVFFVFIFGLTAVGYFVCLVSFLAGVKPTLKGGSSKTFVSHKKIDDCISPQPNVWDWYEA